MVNNVVLIGRITRDIEMNLTNTGTNVCRFTLAVNRNRKNSNGEYDADFISCVAFGQIANFMSQYVKKGYQVSVVGRIQTGSYENQQGQKVYTTDVIVENLNNLEPRRENPFSDYSKPQNNDFNNNTNYQTNNASGSNHSQNNEFNNNNGNGSFITDDDLPF